MKTALLTNSPASKTIIATEKLIVGWQEWCALPELGLPAIKAKIDTGAKTSAIHAFNVMPYTVHGVDWVKFEIHPLQHNDNIIIACIAPLVDERIVMNSGGHREKRFVIETMLNINGISWPIEITLTNRDSMQFRMLLGRDALKDHTIIEPAQMLLQPHYNRHDLKLLYPRKSNKEKPRGIKKILSSLSKS